MSDPSGSHDTPDHRNQADSTPVALTLDSRAERRLIRASGSSSYLDVVIRASQAQAPSRLDQPPMHLALVIDRSGSMSGGKVQTAKHAALAVLDSLSEKDTASVVVFDQAIDVVQSEAKVTPLVKAHVAAELSRIDARGSTALHEGWLVGCQSIAAAEAEAPSGRAEVRRCFLLTDGQANVGLSDHAALALEAGQVREHARVSTSTFGIGSDYDEELLGPMAESGGGQFYHLRRSEDIAATFLGELQQMLGTLAREAQLEVEAIVGVSATMVSAFEWQSGAPAEAGAGRWKAIVGDLVGGEERHLVMRLSFLSADAEKRAQTVRVRLSWIDQAGSHTTDWQQVAFHYAASDAEYDAEARDETVLHYAAKHLSDRGQRDAISARKRGDLAEALGISQGTLDHLRGLRLSPDDTTLRTELQSLREMDAELSAPTLDAESAKSRYYSSHTRSRSKSDYYRQQEELRRRAEAEEQRIEELRRKMTGQQPPTPDTTPDDPGDGDAPTA